MAARRGVSGKSRNYQKMSAEDARRAKSAGQRGRTFDNGVDAEVRRRHQRIPRGYYEDGTPINQKPQKWKSA